MHTYKYIGIAALAFSCAAAAATDSAAPNFGKLAPASANQRFPGNVIQKPQVKMTPAPRVSEIRLVPGTDGKLHQVCHEVKNPRRPRDTDATVPSGGAQR